MADLQWRNRRPIAVQVYGIGSVSYPLNRMRVRVLRSLSGVLDRVKLSSFKPGLSYDVDPSLGQYLISQRFAEELTDTDPVLIVPLDETYIDFDHLRGGIEIVRSEPEAVGPRSTRRSFKRR